MKIVGIKIDTKSPKTQDKIYYYKTKKELKYGDRINVKVESGGTPSAIVIIENNNKVSSKNLKKLEIVD